MKARSLITLIFSIWMASCIATPESPTISPATQPATYTPLTIQQTSSTSAPQTSTPPTGSFELIGHSPLLQRGMNAALAVYGNYAYVGSRTDGSHADAGVLVVDISNPANPQVVYQIGPPDEGLEGQTSRELRVWPEQELLLILNFNCSAVLHDCA